MASTPQGMQAEEEFIRNLRSTFVQEANEFIEACEESFMSLEDPAQRTEALADIFRAYHTVKGSAATINCEDLASFAHAAEDCLAVFRKNPDALTAQASKILLHTNDMIRLRLGTIEKLPQNDPSWETGEVRAALLALIESVESQQDSGAQATPTFEFASPEGKETGLSKSPDRPAHKPALALKIDAARVDSVMDMVGELVVIKSQIAEGLAALQLDPRIRTLIGQLDKSVRELHERTLSMRMISLKSTFQKLQRAVKDVAGKLGKEVHFEVHGEDTEIDRAMVERIADPLMHLCRNSVDHGLEGKDDRVAKRKNPSGNLALRAFRKGETVVIEVQDDGRGIDKHAVVRKAIERGMLPKDSDPEKVPDREAFGLIFLPGFSTSAKITDISGRGVGLDVVKSNINAINGTIEIESRKGEGTLFRLGLPLTTAITDGIVVSVSDKPYILPLETVIGFHETHSAHFVRIDPKTRLVKIKDIHYPYVRLGDFVGVEQSGESGLIVLIEAMGKQLALLVDRVLGKTQVVLKPIGTGVGSTEGLGGAAVMGNGKVALIIDVSGLASLSEKAQLAASQYLHNEAA